MIRYFAFDTETGGLDNTIHEVLALAYVLLDENAEIVAEGQWFAFPSDDVNVDSFAAKVNGYTRESWAAAGALTQDQLFAELTALWQRFGLDRCFALGQNVGFDLGFLAARARKDPRFAEAYRKALSYHSIDTITLAVVADQAHGMSGASTRYRLENLAERWGVPLLNAHDALSDIQATVGVFQAYLELQRRGPAPAPPIAARVLEKLADDRFAFTVGKNKGRALDDLDPGYLRWAVNNMTLRAEEKQVLEAAYARRMRG